MTESGGERGGWRRFMPGRGREIGQAAPEIGRVEPGQEPGQTPERIPDASDTARTSPERQDLTLPPPAREASHDTEEKSPQRRWKDRTGPGGDVPQRDINE